MSTELYTPSIYGKKEEDMHRTFRLQLDDSRNYFLQVIKPRLDRSYKLYIAYTGDRAKEIKKWQSNIFVPYVQAVVETLMPRILDARPEFSVLGRTEDDHEKSLKQQQLADYFWEISGMDDVSEDFVRASIIYGTSFLQVSWKKDVRRLKFLDVQDIASKKLKWKEEERVFYDAPFCEWVDNYSLWYDWHNIERHTKQFWFKRLVLNEAQIRRKYPAADPRRLKMALNASGGDLTDYAAVRQETRMTHEKITKGADGSSGSAFSSNRFQESTSDPTMKMYEVFEWIRPFEDEYAVMVGASHVPILKGGSMPILFDFKEAPFIDATYLKIPGEFEGYGVPLILENPQIMLNVIKNQRIDAATLSIHKMWIVNPLANIDKTQLVTRPFGIIYSIDPNGVKEIQFSDIKSSAYREEEMLKGDMRYSSGVDDFSMGVGGGAGSATEIRHLRESTLERVRLFVNHLGFAYSELLRYWMDMSRQLFTKEMTIRIVGDDGNEMFPIVEKDDLMGNFDYRARVLPSIAGQADVRKKQDMDLFQLLITMPFVDPRKLTSKVLTSWNWSLDSISKAEEEMEQEMEGGMGGEEGAEGMPPGAEGMDPMAAMVGGGAPQGGAPMPQGRQISPEVLESALAMLHGGEGSPAAGPGAFSEMSSPVNLLQHEGMPPTPQGVRASPTTNPRGHNMGGKVNTNIPIRQSYSAENNLMNRAFNIQS